MKTSALLPLLLAMAVVDPSEGASQTVSDGTYRIVSKNSGKPLDLDGSSTSNGAKVVQKSWSSSSKSQEWIVRHVGKGMYRVDNAKSGKAMEVAGRSTSDGAAVQQYDYGGGANQQWEMKKVGNSGYYALLNRNGWKTLQAEGCSKNDGTRMVQLTYSGDDCQKWEMKKVSGSTAGGSTAPSPTPPSPSPSGGCSGGTGAWGNCVKTKCCSGGYTCYEANQWYAQCRKDCNVAGWTCKKLGGGSSSPSSSPPSSGPSPPPPSPSESSPPSSSNSDTGSPIGFASMGGGTTGGAGGSVKTVSSCSALISAVKGNSKKVVQLKNGNIDCRTSKRTQQACPIKCTDGSTWFRVPTSSQTCSSLGGIGNIQSKSRNEQGIKVGSYTTIIGLGSSSKVTGASLSLDGQKQIILKNFHLTEVNPSLVEAGDGVSIEKAQHIWLDHMAFSRISDGYFDIKSSKYVTVSNSHINGWNTETCKSQHWYVSLVKDSEVTFHHNFWDRPAGRNPKVQGGSARAHLFNNYYKGVHYFCISSNDGARVLVENNYFDDSRYPHWKDGGSVSASGNTYTGESSKSGAGRSTGGSSFSPGYSYSKDSASAMTSLPGKVGPK